MEKSYYHFDYSRYSNNFMNGHKITSMKAPLSPARKNDPMRTTLPALKSWNNVNPYTKN